uniref:Uncharacterized protein n=1 Tax=Steinernema glaseri TaxID=37863 RepID=A0A1I7Z0N7_9BILA
MNANLAPHKSLCNRRRNQSPGESPPYDDVRGITPALPGVIDSAASCCVVVRVTQKIDVRRFDSRSPGKTGSSGQNSALSTLQQEQQQLRGNSEQARLNCRSTRTFCIPRNTKLKDPTPDKSTFQSCH